MPYYRTLHKMADAGRASQASAKAPSVALRRNGADALIRQNAVTIVDSIQGIAQVRGA